MKTRMKPFETPKKNPDYGQHEKNEPKFITLSPSKFEAKKRRQGL